MIVVTYDSAAEIRRSLPAIAAELREGDELIVCDNASSDGSAALAAELAPAADLLEPGANLGFGGGCNLAAAHATNELLLFLNPDAVVEPGFRDAIELPLLEERGWDAWQGLVTAEGGRLANTWGGVIHFTGIAWAGGAGRPVEQAPATPREISFASGACLAVRREAFEALGGFDPEYFLYHEDTDLGLRLWLGGRRVGLEPRARCEHEYEFAKGSHKWFFLERNRYATVIRTYPPAVLALALPAMAAAELALLAIAARDGWLAEKLRAYRATARALPRLRRERAAIDARAGGAGAAIDAGRFAALLTPELDSEFLGAAGRSALLAALLRTYWRLARRLLG